MKKIIFSLIYLVIIFSVSQFVFVPANLYYEINWLDIPMHILGGLGVASLAVSVLKYLKIEITFWKVIVPFFVIAILWEVYEYVYSLYGTYVWGGWFDTIKDIIDGFIGAYISFYFSKK